VIFDILKSHIPLLYPISHASILKFCHLLSISYMGVLVTWSLSLELISVFLQTWYWLSCCVIFIHWYGGLTQE
jgi:hypothetical protein